MKLTTDSIRVAAPPKVNYAAIFKSVMKPFLHPDSHVSISSAGNSIDIYIGYMMKEGNTPQAIEQAFNAVSMEAAKLGLRETSRDISEGAFNTGSMYLLKPNDQLLWEATYPMGYAAKQLGFNKAMVEEFREYCLAFLKQKGVTLPGPWNPRSRETRERE